MVQWNVLDNLRLTGMTTYREKSEVVDPYFDAAGDPKGGVEEDSDTSNDYTLRLDWTPEISTGYLLVHVDYVFREDTESFGDDAIFVDGPWYFQDKKQLSARVSWQNESDTIEVALWGKNLLDEEYAANPSGFAADELGTVHTNIDDPITYGLDLRYSF